MRDFLANLTAIGRVWSNWVDRQCERWIGGTGVRRCLLDLGLDTRKLLAQSRARLEDEARRPHSPRRIALRFFTWYVVEAPDFAPRAMKGRAPVTNALIVIQGWCQTDPELVKTAAPDFHRLRVHLFNNPERAA